MPLTIKNCKVLYVRTIQSGTGKSSDIVHLAAKLEDKTLSIWIESSQPLQPGSMLTRRGFKMQGPNFFRTGEILQTKQLKSALEEFLSFIMPGPVYLVAHSSNIGISLLLGILRKIGMLHITDIIKGVVDTVPIFRKQYPSLKGKNPFRLPVLLPYLLGREYTGNYEDSSYYLEVLDELVTKFLPEALLIEYERSVEKVWANLWMIPSGSSRDLSLLKAALSKETVKKLKKAGISFPVLEKLSEQPTHLKLHKYLTDEAAKKLNQYIQSDVAVKIFNFFNKRKSRSNRARSFATQQEELIDQIGPPMEERETRNSNEYLYPRQRHELVDNPDSFLEELLTPYDNDHSLIQHQEERNAEIPSFIPQQETGYDHSYTREQYELMEGLSSLMEEEQKQYDNYHSLIQHQEERNAEIPSFISEQNARDDYSFTREQYELIEELSSLMED